VGRVGFVMNRCSSTDSHLYVDSLSQFSLQSVPAGLFTSHEQLAPRTLTHSIDKSRGATEQVGITARSMWVGVKTCNCNFIFTY
jgi:hypothetical protein